MAITPIRGVLAGAAGTMALDTATYLDMALRGRAASAVPARMAGRFADRLGLDLGDGHGPGDAHADERAADNRREAIGALLGYATGTGVGVVAGLVGLQRRPFVTGSLLTGLGAMVAADASAVQAGVTDPREWGAAGWLADLVPHLLYGAATMAALRALDRRR